MSTLYVNAIEPRTGSTVTFKPNLAITGSLKAGRLSGSTGQSNVLRGDLIVGSYGGTAASLYVSGNLTVEGTTTAVSTTNTIIKDSLIELNNGASSNSNDCGIVIERGSTGDNAIFIWDESADTFQVGTTTATGASTGNLTVTDAAFKAGSLDISGDIDIDGVTNLDNTDIDGTLVVDGSNISLDSTSTFNIDCSNTSNGISIGTATSGVPISIGHATSEVTVNDNLTATGDIKMGRLSQSVAQSNVFLGDVVLASKNGTSADLHVSGAVSAMGVFNPQTMTRTTVPSNTNGVLYGPVTIAAGEQMEISAGSVIKIEDLLR